MQALKTHCQMKHTSLVWFVFSSLAISAFTTEMQTTPCLGREMKLPAHAECMAARPGSQNPRPKTGTFGRASENLDIPVKVSPFCRASYRCFLLWHLITAPLCRSGTFLVSQTRITTTNTTSQAKREPELSPGEDSLPAAFCLRNELSFLLLPRDSPSLLMTWLKLTASTCQGDSASLRRTQCLSWRWDRGEAQQVLESSKNLLYGLLSTRKALGLVRSGSYLGLSYEKNAHDFILFISYILV